jgi:iron complex outermembrane receptor protein
MVKSYLLFSLALVLLTALCLPTDGLSKTPSKKAQLTQEELEKLKQMEELLLGKGELSAIAATYLQKKWELPSAVYTVTSKDIKETGTRRLTDLFRLAPGVAVSSFNRHSSSVSMRGLRSPFFGSRNVQLLAFQDGRYMQSPMFGGTFWEQMPLLLGEIDRIEIMRGPGSALYGANALSGAISVITKDPEKTHGVSLTSGLGSQETAFSDVMFGHGVGNFDFRIGTSYEHDAGYGDHNGMGIEDTYRYSKTTFRGKYRLTPELTAELLAGVTYGNEQPDIKELRERRREHQWPYIQTRLNYKISDTQELLLQHYWQMHSWQEREISSPGDIKETMQEFELRHSIQVGERNHIVSGANLRATRMKSPMLGGTAVVEPDSWQVVSDVVDHDTVTGAFIQDEIKLLENLKATLGVKFEHNTFTDSDYAGRASLVYSPWKEHAFRVSTAKAFRTPHFAEDALNLPLPAIFRVSVPPGMPFSIVGEKRLDNENLRSLEFGYTGRFLKKLDVNVETFYYDYDNLILSTSNTVVSGTDPSTGLPALFRTFSNLDNAVAKGIEVGLKYPVTKWWEAEVNYSFVDFDDRLDLVKRFHPAHMGNLATLFSLPRDSSARLWLNYFDDITTATWGGTPLSKVGDYVRFDAKLAKDFAKGKGEVSLTGQNLFGDHGEGGVIVPNPAVSTTSIYDVEMDRKIFFTVDLRF